MHCLPVRKNPFYRLCGLGIKINSDIVRISSAGNLFPYRNYGSVNRRRQGRRSRQYKPLNTLKTYILFKTPKKHVFMRLSAFGGVSILRKRRINSPQANMCGNLIHFDGLVQNIYAISGGLVSLYKSAFFVMIQVFHYSFF